MKATYTELSERIKSSGDSEDTAVKPAVVEAQVAVKEVKPVAQAYVSGQPFSYDQSTGKLDLKRYKIDVVEVSGEYVKSQFCGTPMSAPKEELKLSLENVQDALRDYEQLRDQELDENIIALYEEDRPVLHEEWVIMSQALSTDYAGQQDVFALAMHGKRAGRITKVSHGIEDLLASNDPRSALEMLAILKQILKRSEHSDKLYQDFAREIFTAAIKIYCAFRQNPAAFQDLTQWEYAALLFGAKHALLYPKGIQKACDSYSSTSKQD